MPVVPRAHRLLLCSALLALASACRDPVAPGLNSPLGGWTFRQTVSVDVSGEPFTCREEGSLNFARTGNTIGGRWSVTMSSCVPIHVIASRVGTGDITSAAVSATHAAFTLGTCTYSTALHVPANGGPAVTGDGSVTCTYTADTGATYTGYGIALLSR